MRPECRVVLMGCGGVGKSALAIRFATGEYVATYDPTIEDFYRHPVEVSGFGNVSLEILDTAGTGQHYSNNRHLYITSGHVFGLIYSVDSRKSLDSLQELYRDIVRVRGTSSVPIVLVGSKCDVGHTDREVAVDDVRQMVRKSWGVSSRHVPLVIETSAKEGKNIDELFQHMARLWTTGITRSRSLPRIQGSGTLGRSPNGAKKLTLTRHSLMPNEANPASRDGTLKSIHVVHHQQARRNHNRSTWSSCVIL